MTRCDSHRIKCPLCGSKITIILYDTINATLSPKKREELLQGKINVVECPACKKTFKVSKSLLYHDMERNFMVWYYPFESIKHRNFFDVFSIDGHLNDDPALAEESANLGSKAHSSGRCDYIESAFTNHANLLK